MKIYTKTGDDGETGLFGGRRVGKDDLRVGAYGDVDELNAFLGLALTHDSVAKLADEIRAIQGDLFVLGADLSTPLDSDGKTESRTRRTESAFTERLEALLDRLDAGNAPLSSFILPGGDPGAATLQVCRTVCRQSDLSAICGRFSQVTGSRLSIRSEIALSMGSPYRRPNTRLSGSQPSTCGGLSSDLYLLP